MKVVGQAYIKIPISIKILTLFKVKTLTTEFIPSFKVIFISQEVRDKFDNGAAFILEMGSRNFGSAQCDAEEVRSWRFYNCAPILNKCEVRR